MIMDEVVTGYGRTGKKFGIDHWDVCPDLIACGKGLAGGYSPLACAVIHDKIWQVLCDHPSGHTVVGYTHAANPLSTATAKAVLSYILDHELVGRSALVGSKLIQMISDRLGDHPHVGDIRGKGLHMAIEFVQEKETLKPFPSEANVSQGVYAACMRQGLNLCPVHGDSDGLHGDSVIIKPAFTILDSELDELVDKLGRGMEDVAW